VTVSPTTQSKPDANNNQASKSRHNDGWNGLDTCAEWTQMEEMTKKT